MASTINTSNIDTTYPVAGQDNDSQGFRDNFSNTNTNFIAAKAEIEDLQNNVILKSALSGGSLDNDLGGALISNALIQGFSSKVVLWGSVSGAVAIDVSAGPYQKMTPTAAIVLSFTSWPVSGTHGAVQLEIDITNVGYTVTLPAAVTIGINGIQGIAGQVITFAATGTYILEFGSALFGTEISVHDLTPTPLEPAASIATTGAVALDLSTGTYFYNTATTGIITFTFTNPATTGNVTAFTLELFGGGTNAPVWPASVKWPGGTEPTWTAGVDLVSFITRDAGTTYYGMIGGLAFA